MKKISFIAALAGISLVSCHDTQSVKDCNFTCHSGPAMLYFLNYTVDSLDTVYIKTYAHDSTFVSPLSADSFYSPSIFTRMGDTGLSYNTYVSIDKDYEITLKRTHEVIRIHPIDSQVIMTDACTRTAPCYTAFSHAIIPGKTFKLLQTDPNTVYLGVYKN